MNIFLVIKSFFQKLKESFFTVNSSGKQHLHEYFNDYLFEIDDKTYTDLQLSDFEEEFNQTYTSCGDEIFLHFIKSIREKEDILKTQKDIIKLNNFPKKELITKILKKVNKQKRGNAVDNIWNNFIVQSTIINNFYIFILVNIVISILISIININFLPFSFIFFFLYNFVLYILTNKKISQLSGSINYILTINSALKKIDKKTDIQLNIEKPNYRKLQKIEKYILFFKDGIGGSESGDILSIFLDYMRVFFAMELFAFVRTQKIIKTNIEEIKKIYYYIGYLDFILNANRIIDENQTCFSKIIENKKITFTNMTHPLLEKSVAQNWNITDGLIITGLNMSGKTTFMKALAINQLLSTSFGFCFSNSFETQIFNIITSFRINDNLKNGESRYYAEANRLLEIKNQLSKNKTLCLIDEILSGTNSEDRIEGATIILKEFAKNKESVIVAATHDNKIATELSPFIETVYFDGEIENDKINFDYTIKKGIVSKRNGLLILRLIGLENMPGIEN